MPYYRAFIPSLLLGCSICVFPNLDNSYAKTASVVDHFALLVGIDRYAQPSDKTFTVQSLQGPENDVALMKRLLVEHYRFPDDSQHIKTLIGSQATHAAIIEAFKSQLIESAKKNHNAVIVFYFSGHGSQANNISPDDSSWHDTLVAYDSRTDQGADILDNEIVDLFDRLRELTPNSTFILDSCHSGDAIKGIGSLLSRELPPKLSRSKTVVQSLRDRKIAESIQGSQGDYADRALTRRHQFTLLSASLAEESSYEDVVETPAGPKNHGFFTYYLAQTLRQRPSSSAEKAIRDTTSALGSVRPHPPSQHPVAVGDVERELFGGPSDRDDPYIPILDVRLGATFQIGAGAVNGLRSGAFLAIYESSTKHLVGEAGKIANAQVIKVDATTAEVTLADRPKHPVTKQDKVAVVTPYFGFAPLLVRLPDYFAYDSKADDRRLLHDIAGDLANNKLVELVSAGNPFDLTLKNGCASAAGKLILHQHIDEAHNPPCKTKVYYITTHSNELPLFDYFVAGDEKNAGGELADRISLRAKQLNVRGLENAQSPMRGKVTVTLEQVDIQKDPLGGPGKIVTTSNMSDRTAATLRVGQHFQIKIDNGSDQDLYVGTLMLGTSGAIELITTNPHGDKVYAHTSLVLHSPRDVGPPLGIETYKIIATTSSDVDFRTFEQPSGRKGITSPLEWLMNQTVNTQMRDSSPSEGAAIDDWVTDNFDLRIER